MTAEQLTSLTPFVMALVTGIAWLVRRQAAKRDVAEKEARDREKTEEATRVAQTPELQKIVADQVQDLLKSYADQNRQLIEDNTEQRRRHAEDRRSWESERRAEREEWQRQVTEWEQAKLTWDKERERFRVIIDELREELGPYRRAAGARTRVEDGNG